MPSLPIAPNTALSRVPDRTSDTRVTTAVTGEFMTMYSILANSIRLRFCTWDYATADVYDGLLRKPVDCDMIPGTRELLGHDCLLPVV